jgi:5-methyltetrahydrofolate--homocysteine methyltransferase
VREADARALVMASEGFGPGGASRANRTAAEVHETARWFAARLRSLGGRRANQIIVDPGLVPVAADTSGLVNRTLDALELMSSDPELRNIHYSVGLTNFSFGLPRELRLPVENAFLTLATRTGLDTVLGNPEKDYGLVAADDTVLHGLAAALAAGRPAPGQSAEDAAFAMIERLTELYRETGTP